MRDTAAIVTVVPLGTARHSTACSLARWHHVSLQQWKAQHSNMQLVYLGCMEVSPTTAMTRLSLEPDPVLHRHRTPNQSNLTYFDPVSMHMKSTSSQRHDYQSACAIDCRQVCSAGISLTIVECLYHSRLWVLRLWQHCQVCLQFKDLQTSWNSDSWKWQFLYL